MSHIPAGQDFEIVPWNPGFDTGLAIIDEQHRRLVQLLNDLARQYVHGIDMVAVRRIVAQLADYTVYHFHTEESLWTEGLAGDAWTEGHERAHAAFVAKVQALQAELAQPDAAPPLGELLSFLTRWLAHHILYEDKRMAVALQAVRRGATPEAAKQLSLEAMSGQTSGLIQSVLSMYELLSSRTLALEREIHARQRAEQALSEQEAHWKTVLGASHDNLWDWDFSTAADPASSHPDHWLAAMEQTGQGTQRIHPDDWPGLRAALLEHLLGKQAVFSHQHRVLDDAGQVRWLQSRGKVVQRDADGHALRMVGTQTDITERKTAELTLKRELDTRLIISDFATDFMASSLGDFDAAIRRALQRSGEYLQADRTYVFLLTDDGAYMDNIHEWCAPGVEPEIDQLQGIPADATPWWWQQLRDVGHVLVPRVADMPPEARAEQAILQGQDIQSVCVYPLRMGGQLVGFVGNDAVARERAWGTEVLEFLGLMSDLLSIALDHRHVHQLRVQALDRLELAEQQAHLGHWESPLIRANAVGIWSAEMRRIFELPDGTTGLTFDGYLERLHPDDRSAVRALFLQAFNSCGEFHSVHRAVMPDGRIKHIEALGRFDRGPEGRAVLVRGTAQDISEKVRHQDELQRLAYQDPLTQLPNRRALEDTLRRELQLSQRSGQPLAVAMLDLDNFHEANEQHGQTVGDRLLTTLGQRMRLLFDGPGAVSRLGGDEFVVLLTGLQSSDDHMPRLNRLLASISEPMTLDGIALSTTASIGVTTFPQPVPVSAEQLLRQAQQALFQAKLDGKNRFHLYDTAQETHTLALAERLNDIQRALTAGEFLLYYQPKVHLRSGTVHGVEALIRWQRPDGALLSPGDFLPTIQDHPLEIELGDWVIRTALEQLSAWQRQGLQLQVSVNVSSLQVQADAFVDKLRAALAEHPEVAPAALQLEILESSALQDIAKVSHIMQQCRQLGVSFALDDFGTGFSSLAYLKHLPATVLKIDQGFVRDMLESADDLSIISGVVGMAKAFGLQVIAEGVETAEHGDLLLRLGCEQGQGYGIARPMPAAELPRWVKNWKPYRSWREQVLVRAEDLPVLYATVEHRRWIRGLEQMVQGERELAPPLDHHQCRLGHWIDGDGRPRYGHRPEFQRLDALHRDIHRLGQALVDLHSEGRDERALATLPELRDKRDILLAELKSLIR